MWFKNLRIFRLATPFTLPPEALDDALRADAFRPCGSLEPATVGWVPPLGRHGDLLTHVVDGRVLLCARREERLLPGGVLQEQLEEKVQAIEEAEGRPVRRKERMTLKDELLLELMPKAFTRSRLSYAYLDPKLSLLVVEAASAVRAEEVVSLLRNSVGSLPAAPLATADSPAVIMTGWLQGNGLPGDFVLGDECELAEPGEGGAVVRLKRHDLGTDEVATHLSAGKRAAKLALTYDDRVSFVLQEDLAIKRLAFTDMVLDELEGVGDDPVAAMDARFALTTLELARVLPRLIEVFGGDAAPANPVAAEPLAHVAELGDPW